MTGMVPSIRNLRSHTACLWFAVPFLTRQLLPLLVLSGCVSAGHQVTDAVAVQSSDDVSVLRSNQPEVRHALPTVVSFQQHAEKEDGAATLVSSVVSPCNLQQKVSDVDSQELNAESLIPVTVDSLAELEVTALGHNPSLRRLAQEAEAARARVNYVDGLPDPTIGANVFIAPIETAAGAQRANLTIGQMLPWMSRLDAQAKQACFEALASQQVYAAERLRVVGNIRILWYRLYVIGKQTETIKANQDLIEGLIDVTNARIETSKAMPGDVLVATLEYSKLEEQLVSLRQQQLSVVAEINNLLGRQSEATISSPTELNVQLPDWSHSSLRQMANEYQPEIQAARIRTQATRWGLEVARLRRRPDLSVNATWFAIDNDRPATSVVGVGDDAWSLGASVSIPLWDRKYDAIEREANWKHSASCASVDEVIRRYDAVLRDLWEQAKAADETATLYQVTILPQARHTLAIDQQSYINGTVDFDRVITDVRNLLTLELGYHRTLGELAISLSRIKQATGQFH